MTVDVTSTHDHIAIEQRWGAHDYVPLPVVLSHGEGAWMTDVDGRRYLDFLAGYSALNFGHRHPDIVAAAKAQLDRLTLTSRVFYHDQFGMFCRELAELTGSEMVLPSNSGGEADSERDFLERVRTELFEDRVYALTPKGEVIDLPRGATPLDFAYQIHTSLGHRCKGAKVNGRIVPLRTQLQNGDQVEIIRSKTQVPSAATGAWSYSPANRGSARRGRPRN